MHTDTAKAETSPTQAALVLRGGGGQVGAERIALLAAIQAHGSISGAARSLGLSYKGAWDAVQALNNLFERPLVAARPGGRAGGAAEVTAQGRAVIAAFHLLERELAKALALVERSLDLSAVPPPTALLWSLSMKTSARNALRGVVTEVTDGAVNAEVALRIGEGQTLVAILTRDSVRALGLVPGREAIALIKSSFVILSAGAEPPRTSARNALPGVVIHREDGAVNSEISLEIEPGKTLTATVTLESARALGLVVGAPACALIKASHVILAVE
ncbi:MAG: TOBE domain-containing protein [Caulobacteraceae bacterium]|nr:TOBE domain-containing protein [Caulobacteraceae bacterium]